MLIGFMNTKPVNLCGFMQQIILAISEKRYVIETEPRIKVENM